MKLAAAERGEETEETKEIEAAKHEREQVSALLKEIRGLLEELKAERQKAKAGEKK